MDINGDGRVERHEIKQMVQLAGPQIEHDRQAYLDEVGKFKDMIRDCDVDKDDGEITPQEGVVCLERYPRHQELFEECDENNDGRLVKDEFRNHITRVRERMGVNYKSAP